MSLFGDKLKVNVGLYNHHIIVSKTPGPILLDQIAVSVYIVMQ